jgi:Zn-dependent protease
MFVVLHELGHVLALKLLKIPIKEIRIGDLISFRMGIFVLSPIILSSHVEFYEEEFSRKPRWNRALVFVAGPLVNIILFLIIPQRFFLLRIMNWLVFLTNVLPLFPHSDGREAVKELLHK